MFDPVVTRDPTAVQVEVQKAYLGMFPGGEKLFVPRVFGWAIECFTGHYPEYLAVDARYHDFEHTLQGTLCLARLLACRHQAGAKPVATEKLFQLAIIGVLLHDTGYLKRRDDVDGTGAKYTATHVYRSADFALRLLAGKGFTREEIASVQNMIRCTGVDAMLHEIPFQSKLEEVLGHALGTADLLGQMAAEDYVEKLPVLYAEFVEAAKHDRGHTDFISKFGGEHDLMQRTPSFWQDYVKPKLDRDFDGLHRYLNQPYPNGKNWYVDCIEANMVKLKEHLAAKV